MLPPDEGFRTVAVKASTAATVEIRNHLKHGIRGAVRVEYGFGMPSVLVVEIYPERFEKEGLLFVPSDTADDLPKI